MAADARRAGQVGDLVVVSLHWGSEGVHAPTSAQRAVAEKLLPSDNIDLVVGHHAHAGATDIGVRSTPTVGSQAVGGWGSL